MSVGQFASETQMLDEAFGIVSAKAFGAKGDGRPDDTDALQAADSERAGKSRIRVLPLLLRPFVCPDIPAPRALRRYVRSFLLRCLRPCFAGELASDRERGQCEQFAVAQSVQHSGGADHNPASRRMRTEIRRRAGPDRSAATSNGIRNFEQEISRDSPRV